MSNVFSTRSGVLGVLVLAGAAIAHEPQMGGEMEHIMMHLHGSMLHAHVHNAGPLVLQNYHEAYKGEASVLDGQWYNSQYGWMVEGFWAPPSGSVIWIEQVSATPGLHVYSGGTMMNMRSFAPIFGTGGSSPRIQWDGLMLHNWYAATEPGTYSATYSIYFGDANGMPTPGYMPAQATLSWELAPPPCSGDVNGDRFVNGADLSVLLGNFGGVVSPGTDGDLNGDGTVNGADLSVLLSRFGLSC